MLTCKVPVEWVQKGLVDPLLDDCLSHPLAKNVYVYQKKKKRKEKK